MSRVTHYKRLPLAGLVRRAGGDCLVLALFARQHVARRDRLDPAR